MAATILNCCPNTQSDCVSSFRPSAFRARSAPCESCFSLLQSSFVGFVKRFVVFTMPINGKALFDAAVLLAEQEQWRLTMKYSTGTGIANVLSGMAGRYLLGAPGILIGVGISAVGSYIYTRNKYKPVFVILKEDLRPSQQEELIRLLMEAFKDFSAEDVMIIAQLMMDKREIGLKLKDVVMPFLMKHFIQQVHIQSENTQYTSNEKMVL